LYEQLPDKSKVRVSAGVVDIIESDDSVKVILTDGSIEEGDLVIGCDGVHSLVRSLMWRNANTAIPGMITTAEKRCKILCTHGLVQLQAYFYFMNSSTLRLDRSCWI
jgi:2-polyprenyl-6-methoxyphenol hydroxylase-like FAD-dependent oxidoreductase